MNELKERIDFATEIQGKEFKFIYDGGSIIHYWSIIRHEGPTPKLIGCFKEKTSSPYDQRAAWTVYIGRNPNFTLKEQAIVVMKYLLRGRIIRAWKALFLVDLGY